MRTFARLYLALVCVVALTSGCGAGSAAIAGATGGSSGTTVTALAIDTPDDGLSGRIELRLFLGVDERHALRVVSIEFSPFGDLPGTFVPATIANGFPSELGPGTTLLGSRVGLRDSAPFVAVWNSAKDFNTLIDTSQGPATLGRRRRGPR